jgi:hypothetical protein
LPAAPQSGLDMIQGGTAPSGSASNEKSLPVKESARPSGAAPPGAPGSAESAFTKAVRKSEARAEALAIKYTERYPAIAQYGFDWMSHSDLKKLNDDYMRDHDPVKFLRGLAAAKSFPELTAKYASDPAVQAFVKDALKDMPHDVLEASSGMLVQDGVLRALLSDSGKALGLPKSFTDGLRDYAKDQPTPASSQPPQAQPTQ